MTLTDPKINWVGSFYQDHDSNNEPLTAVILTPNKRIQFLFLKLASGVIQGVRNLIVLFTISIL